MSRSCHEPQRVLLVENDPVARGRLVEALRLGGFEALAVPGGESALLTLCEQRDDIAWLMTELRLPGLICGRVLADEYHRHRPDRPVVFLDAGVPDRRPCEDIGAGFTPSGNPVEMLGALVAAQGQRPMGFKRFQG